MTYVNGYEGFLSRKEPHVAPSGLTTIPPLPSCLKPFQKIIVRWALRQGRCALFESTGLGKTLQQLVWADVVARHTKGRVLLFTPLAVAQQTVAEAEKFNIQGVAYAPDFAKANTRIVVTNYDRLHNFPLDKFAGVVLDESSILKAESGKTKDALIDGCQSIPWRLACTATPAPNDYKEFGNHSEFLGVMDQKEMLAMYFVHDGAIRAAGELEWRLKGHAKDVFWQWVTSWSVILRSPSDLGLDGTEYELPPLQKHSIVVNTDLPIQDGYFFAPEKLQLSERIHARSETVEPRCRAAAEIVNAQPDRSWLIWCGLNKEADLLTKLIHDAEEVRGSDEPDDKVEKLLGFCHQKPRVLVTKPSIAGWGLNWQHCSDIVFVGLNDSFEQLYQAIRRCWRFGQTKPVNVWIVSSDYEGAVVRNVAAKEKRFEIMYENAAKHAQRWVIQNLRMTSLNEAVPYAPKEEMEHPQWL
jgi:hypothetical protein